MKLLKSPALSLFLSPSRPHRLLHPKIVRACTLVLTDWTQIPSKALKAAVTILHRIAYGCSCPGMLYQVSVCVNVCGRCRLKVATLSLRHLLMRQSDVRPSGHILLLLLCPPAVFNSVLPEPLLAHINQSQMQKVHCGLAALPSPLPTSPLLLLILCFLHFLLLSFLW